MDRERILYEGILVGLAGAAAVAVWFFLYDLAAATPFRTRALLGALLFEGLRDTATLTIAPGIVHTVMGKRVNPPLLRWFGWATALIMTAATVGMLVTL